MKLRHEPTMNVAKQRRKLEALLEREGRTSYNRHLYLRWLISYFDLLVLSGNPTPASELIPMYREEFE